MSDEFDPYYTWLAIGPEEQPPTLYRLLGLRPFEDNAEVIENAADQRMAHLRTLQSGKHGRASQQLLNEVANAKLRLLSKERKAEYDEDLREEMTRQARETRRLPETIGFLQHVEGCTLVGNGPKSLFDDSYAKELEAFTDIEHLTLIGFEVAASGVERLRRLAKLQTVYISDCRVAKGENVALPVEQGRAGEVRVRTGLYSADHAAQNGQRYLTGPQQWGAGNS